MRTKAMMCLKLTYHVFLTLMGGTIAAFLMGVLLHYHPPQDNGTWRFPTVFLFLVGIGMIVYHVQLAALTRFIQKHIKNRHVRGFYLDSFTKNGIHTMHWINSRQDCYVLGAQIAYTLRNHPVYTLIYKLYIHEKAYGYVFPRIPERKHL